MSIVVRFTPAGLTAEQYGKAVRMLEDQGAFPPEGLDYHVCFGSDGDLRVSEIRDSEEQFEAFGELLHRRSPRPGSRPRTPRRTSRSTTSSSARPPRGGGPPSLTWGSRSLGVRFNTDGCTRHERARSVVGTASRPPLEVDRACWRDRRRGDRDGRAVRDDLLACARRPGAPPHRCRARRRPEGGRGHGEGGPGGRREQPRLHPLRVAGRRARRDRSPAGLRRPRPDLGEADALRGERRRRLGGARAGEGLHGRPEGAGSRHAPARVDGSERPRPLLPDARRDARRLHRRVPDPGARRRPVAAPVDGVRGRLRARGLAGPDAR